MNTITEYFKESLDSQSPGMPVRIITGMTVILFGFISYIKTYCILHIVYSILYVVYCVLHIVYLLHYIEYYYVK